jgi:hypothetical protein
MDGELPWHLAETETWTELIAPYLEAQIVRCLDCLCAASSNDDRAILQGQIIAYRALQDAPEIDKHIKSLNQQMKERQEKLADAPRERRRSLARPTKRVR